MNQTDITKTNVPENIENQIQFDDRRSTEDGINLLQYVDIVVRNWWVILLIASVIFALSSVYEKRQQKEYVYNFSIVYQEKAKDIDISGLSGIQGKTFDKNLWLNVAKSRLIMQYIIDENSYQSSPEQLQSMLKVSQKREADNIFDIQISSPDSSMLKSFARGLVTALNKYDRRLLRTNMDSLTQVLNVQNADNDSGMTLLNAQIKNYYTQNNLMQESDLRDKLAQLNRYKSDLTTATVELSAVRASMTAIEAKLGINESDISELMTNNDPLMTELMSLQMELASNKTKYSEKHPKIVATQKSIQNIKNLISKGLSHSDSLNGYSQNRMRQNQIQQYITLSSQVIEYETKIASWQEVITELNKTVADVINSDDSLQELLKKKQLLEQSSIEIQKSLLNTQTKSIVHTSSFLMLDEPKTPTNPVSKHKIYLLVGLILGFGFGFALVVLYEAITGKIYSTDRLEHIANCPIICSIPVLGKKLKNVLHEEAELKEFLLPFTVLKVKVKVLYVKNKCNYITIVSPEKQEGKTTTCISLALSLANDGFRVLLVDADLWSPASSKAFNMTGKPGLSNFLHNHRLPLEAMIYPTHIENLQVLPAGTELDNIGNILRPDTINELQNEVRQMYDWVITDTPALLLVPDSYEFVKFSPTILMIARMSHTKLVDFKEMVMHLNMAQIKLTGVILNGMKRSIMSKYYQPSYTFRYDYYNKYNKDLKKDALTEQLDL
ncbi:MAG: hypothetical protein CVU48_10010 [Candidatus Cloacimonetes bacterium HGW-Cloacimonetes-1]|nr:MAG: hypothetical protein CVU48_10010 [Candidatus Cloacimonetes bacterium HGW-Cloacimonetes-1]